ncbi:dihydrolipoamide acetyltransferase family protein [Streptomyces palmae]|uniref:Dihydrolipoamide acetyltransferase component of pyruvate dehydrogenase complex n=1 Tax=Streptomyces palmae TaxID=1701085 RepID=A0A4Z0H8X0_9ACTN|nr:dihydrolipoamide acetyltransferase family protein [Streptomyces palmae]TGB05630.1 2-oxo acid dehydrogenase subunit E2 [Streptomyces palmae]
MAVEREFTLPDLGEGLTEALIVQWLVKVGDEVTVDQLVVEVETAKAMVEVPCPYEGVVTARFGEEGTELPVGAPLLTVAVPGDDPAGDTGPAKSAAPEAEGSGNVLVGYGTGAPTARRRRVRPRGLTPGAPGAASGAVSTTADTPFDTDHPTPPAGRPATGAPSVGGPTPRQPRRPGAPGGSPSAPTAATIHGRPGANAERVPVISPLVRRLAREHGLDLRQLAGSGPDGLILRADVERAVRAAAEGVATTAVPGGGPLTQPAGSPPAGAGAVAAAERIPLRGLRGAVADKLSRSRAEIPDATCWVDADATELLAARAAMNAAGGPKISLLALLARICTAGLARFPELNATVDMAAREIVRLPAVHLGFAAQTDRGLVVPVVRDAHTRSAEELGAEMARLTEVAREGRLSPADLTGGTFTLNNYGVFGVDGSTPIINHPEAAMLGVGRIVPKPWVHQGELAIRQVVQLSFTFDHRVCDGGTAGGFLRYVADCVEHPAVLLRTV